MVVRYNWIFCSGVLVLGLLASSVWAAPEDVMGGELQQSDLTLEELDAELAALEAELAGLDSEPSVEEFTFESDDEAQSEEDFDLGNVAYRRGRLTQALDFWNAAARRDYAPAQARLGTAFDYTDEDDLAVGWFKMSAAQGDAWGAWGLGSMYLKGEGVKKNAEKAAYWIRFAAEKDLVPAIQAMDQAYQEPDRPNNFLGEDANDQQQAEYWANKQKVIGGAAREAMLENVAYEKKRYIDRQYEQPNETKKAEAENIE